MNHQKTHRFRPPLYHHRAGTVAAEPRVASKQRSEQDNDQERRGWEAYRKWLSTMSTRPASDRAPHDHSIYSWKGYQSWADKIRQAWKPENS